MGVISESMWAGGLPEPQEPWRVTAKGDTPIGLAHNTLKAFDTTYGRFLEHVDARNGQLTSEGRAAEIAAFACTQAAKSVDEAEQLAINRTAQAQAEVDKIKRDLTPHGAPDTAAELRATRAWHRTVRALDGCTESSAVAATVGRLIADADRETLGTLLEELPSYCASRGVPGEVVDQAVYQAVPELAAAQQQLAKSQAAEAIVRADANRRRDGLSQGRMPYIPPVDPVKHDPDR